MTVWVNPKDFAASTEGASDDKTVSGLMFQIVLWVVFLVFALLAFFRLFTIGK